jgi:hypothetical protein
MMDKCTIDGRTGTHWQHDLDARPMKSSWHTSQAADQGAMQSYFGIVNAGLIRMRVLQGGRGACNDDNSILAEAGLQSCIANVCLSLCPCNLFDLWTEYTTNGLIGRKPTAQFSHCEHAKPKDKSFDATSFGQFL